MATELKAKITFISAGAGSGKTHRLTEILQHELTHGGVRPAGVIATTFTRRAATELRERVREHLLAKGSFVLANAMGQARIGTINGVCGQLITRFAFEAGMSTDQQVLDEAQAAALLGRAIDAVLDSKAMSDLLDPVRRLGLEQDWKDELRSLVNLVRSNDIPLDRVPGFAKENAESLLRHFPAPTKDNLDAHLLSAIRKVLPEIEATALSGGKKKTKAYLDLVKTFSKALENGFVAWGDWVKLSKEEPEASLVPTTLLIAELAGRAAEHPRLHQDVRRYLMLMFELAARVLTKYQALKQEGGTLDFADQEHQLLGLLEHPEVASVLHDELDLLMVDEFQDTSPIQLALFLKFARFAKKVYWVGDIKQAIYSFRGSDTALMQSIIGALPALGGGKEVLPSSWRSRPELVRIVNAVFSAAFSNTLAESDVILKAERKEQLNQPAFANWILLGKNAAQEASALAVGVKRLIASHYPIFDKTKRSIRLVQFGDIAILARSHEGVKALSIALSAHGIPVATTAQPGLLSTPECTLALAYLRRLNDSGDTVATAEIVSLAGGVDPEDWVVDRLRYLAKGGSADLWLEQAIEGHPAREELERIAALRASLPLLAPREAMETVMAVCRITTSVARWNHDPDLTRRRLANLEALIALAGKYEELCKSGQHAASISGLILWLGEIASLKEDKLAEPAVDAVKVMTHHAAKGLEWPVVVLTDLAAPIKDRLWSISAQSIAQFDAQAPLADRFIRYWPWPFGKQQRVAVADAIDNTPEAAGYRSGAVEESKRLLYVSMTRARDLLVLARSSRKQTGEWIDSINAPWLHPGMESKKITLPTGDTIPAMYWELDALDEIAASTSESAGPQHWFAQPNESVDRLPLYFSPSSAGFSRSTTVLERCQVGQRIQVASGTDMSQLGTALHACIALSFTDRSVPVTEAEILRLLKGYGIDGAVSAPAVLNQVEAFHAWLDARWPAAKAYPEIPVQCLLDSGQILNGRIDLLLESQEGWIVFDHKSSPLAPDKWDQLAIDHGPQLASYADAIERASSKRPLQSWLFLPVAGGALSIAWR